ncbi:hypothetical protein VKT23_009421 [Stygiomarasmius scandens]|uniref:Uncharacterized protein n=1 Tax=Marasmiellus scandens TaxID=2682957 RepID=A0ABR1JJL7_9AGAR
MHYKLKGRGHHSLADDEEEIEVESQASDESDDQLDVIDRSSTPTGEGDNLEKHDEHGDDVHSTEDLEDEEEEDDFDEAGNISFATDHTQPGSDVDKIPDLALVHTRLLWKALCLAEPRNHPALKARNHKLTVHWQHRNGIHIIHGCVPFLGELKSGAPRDLDLKYNNKEAKAKFDEHMTGSGAFVAVGVYWHYAIFEQSDLPDYDWDEMQIKSHGSSKAKHRAFYKKFPKAYYEVGTKESDAAFEEMYQKNIHPLGSDGDLSAEQWSEVEKQD